MIKIKYPSLEYNWLPNSLRKGLVTPRLYLSDDESVGGQYWAEQDWASDYWGFDLSEGPIIILAGLQTPGTIAHEYRHHWQRHNLMPELDGKQWHTPDDWDAYWDAIVDYFRSSICEFDALRYQIQLAPDDFALECWERVLFSTEKPMTAL